MIDPWNDYEADDEYDGYYDDHDDDFDDSDEWVFDCGDAECCMNFQPHFRGECYTPEMYEAYVKEVTRDADQSTGEHNG